MTNGVGSVTASSTLDCSVGAAADLQLDGAQNVFHLAHDGQPRGVDLRLFVGFEREIDRRLIRGDHVRRKRHASRQALNFECDRLLVSADAVDIELEFGCAFARQRQRIAGGLARVDGEGESEVGSGPRGDA